LGVSLWFLARGRIRGIVTPTSAASTSTLGEGTRTPPGSQPAALPPVADTTGTFSAYEIEVRPGAKDKQGIAPVTKARVCATRGRSRLCYTPPDNGIPYGLDPDAEKVTLRVANDALEFRATASAGGSGSSTFLGLLQIRKGRLVDVLPRVVLSEINEYTLQDEPDISPAAILVVANFVWGKNESHFDSHRFRIRSFIMQPTGKYALADEYITTDTYLLTPDTPGVTFREKSTVLARLRQARASSTPSAPVPNVAGRGPAQNP
jgi:hypothetical protein